MIFFVYFEKNWLPVCPSNFKPNYQRRYVDVIFVLFTSPELLEAYRNFLHGRYANMSISIENENKNRMFFLDTQIIREDKTFTTSVYRKPTFSRVYIRFNSFLPSSYKFSAVYTLAYRCFQICSSWTKLHAELLFIKQSFLKSDYP